jgi:CheY-like chemotaxis protein
MRASSGPHILIVEDDGDLLEVLQFVLEDEGYRVSTAKGGAEALTLAASQDVSLVLLDMAMPDIDGTQVAKRLRADPRTAHIRLAIHTGMAASQFREQFSDYDAFIPKTEQVDELLAAIKAAIEQPMRPAVPVANM